MNVSPCKGCGGRMAPLGGRDWSCIECGLIRTARTRPATADRRKSHAERTRNKQQARRAAGLCPRDGRQPEPGKAHCARCLARLAKYGETLRRKKCLN